MSQPICTISTCAKAATRVRRTICEMHYYRLRRNGTLSAQTQRQQRGNCIHAGCDTVDAGPHGYCAKHHTRIVRHGSPDAVLPPGSPAGESHPSRRGERIKIKAAHERVKAAKGRAAEHDCTDCGGPALHWSYNHLDPHELRDPVSGAPYSPRPEYYEPRCVSCHKRFDLRH